MRLIGAILLSLFSFRSVAQQPTADFSIPANACLNQKIVIQNLSANASNYEWDFCQGDLALSPTGSFIRTITGGNFITGLDIVFDGTNWYGFVANRNAHSIVRLDFHQSIYSTPDVIDLGNISGNTPYPTDIKIVTENGNWYGFVYSESAAPKLVSRINFGTSLTNTPSSSTPITADVVVSDAAGGSSFSGFDMAYDGTNWVLVLTFNNTISIIKFPTLGSTPTASDMITRVTNPYAGTLGDIVLQEHNGSFYGYAVSYGNKTMQRLNFGASLFTTPTFDDITSYLNGGGATPYGIEAVYDNGNYYLLIATVGGALLKTDLGNDLSQTPVSGTNLGTMSVLGNTLKLRAIRNGSRWSVFSANFSSAQLYRVDFPNPSSCPANLVSSIKEDTTLYFNVAGTKHITLRSWNAGSYDEMTKAITVSTETAPDIDFSFQNICVNNDVNFDPTSSSGNIISYSWNFGDSNVSSDPSPVHVYSTPGSFTCVLDVSSSNGCSSSVEKEITIYSIPIPDFSLPTGIICTNNDYQFINATIDDFDGYLAYQWEVEAQIVGATRDLTTSFSTGGSKTIKLITTIPGCSSELSKVIPSVGEGPVVDFSISGSCQSEQIVFNSTITGDVSTIAWDFGDSQSGSDANPVHSYSTIGSYSVALQTVSSNGCENTASKLVTIRSRPQPNFSIALPPFSCSGTPTQFNDNTPNPTDSNISSWLWAFNDPESTQNSAAVKNPQHTYKTAGDYSVSLTVTTNYGCSNTIQKAVTISQSPVADFTHSPPCDDVPVMFDASGANIASWQWKIGSNTYFYTNKPQYMFTSPGDYPVNLTVTGSNNCVALVQKTINVPVPFVPDFAVEKNCVGYAAMFTDLTLANTDPITSRQWVFDNAGTATGPAPEFTFTSTGIVPVKLDVTTESGCVYSVTKNINVVEPPLPYFTATPEVGIPPLTVQFLNESANATSYRWHFNDVSDSTTTEYSAQYTFRENGDYLVDLTATNDQKCSHTYSRIITVAKPVTNATLTSFLLQDNSSGLVNAVVTVKNNGNFTLQNIKLLLQIAGVEIAEVIPGPVAPQATVTYMPVFTIVKSKQLTYICANIELEDDIDLTDNQQCVSFESDMRVFEPYPNPSRDHISLEWVTNQDDEATVKVLDVLGIEMYQTSISSTVGLNQVSLSLDGVKNGIYFLVFTSGDNQRKYRFIVNR